MAFDSEGLQSSSEFIKSGRSVSEYDQSLSMLWHGSFFFLPRFVWSELEGPLGRLRMLWYELPLSEPLSSESPIGPG